MALPGWGRQIPGWNVPETGLARRVMGPDIHLGRSKGGCSWGTSSLAPAMGVCGAGKGPVGARRPHGAGPDTSG